MTQVSVQHAIRLGAQHLMAGRAQEAEAIFRAILAANPDQPDALHLMGILMQQRGDHAEAVRLISRALEVGPKMAEAHSNLSTSLRALNDLEPAERESLRAVQLAPTLAAAWVNRAVILHAMARLDESTDCARRAIALQPDLPEAHRALAAALEDSTWFDQAIDSYRRAMELDPRNAAAPAGIGSCLQIQGFVYLAAQWYEKSLQCNERLLKAHLNLAAAQLAMGNIEAAVAHYRRAIELNPAFAAAHDGLLLAMNYHAQMTARQVFDEHVKWGSAIEAKTAISAPAGNPIAITDGRRVRVGYLSPDFRRHSVIYFLEPLLAHHDRARFEVFCYSDVRRSDAWTERCKGYADAWRDVWRMDDAQLAGQIRADRIDILIDLAGHTDSNRLAVFAGKPARVQMSYLGYPHSTGLTRMDYGITDAIADPFGEADLLHTEKLIRLGRCAWCYRPPDDAPDISELPARGAGFVTFGSLNNVAKISPPVMSAWAQLLEAMSQARLLVKSPNLRDVELQRDLRERFAAAGIDVRRVEMMGVSIAPAEHLATYSRIDVALDTFPYNGTTTTCDALWMGVPVVALAGDRHAARVGASLLSAVGCDDWIARDVDGYVARARELAADLNALAEVRRGLRGRMERSALCDGAGLARAIEREYVGKLG